MCKSAFVSKSFLKKFHFFQIFSNQKDQKRKVTKPRIYGSRIDLEGQDPEQKLNPKNPEQRRMNLEKYSLNKINSLRISIAKWKNGSTCSDFFRAGSLVGPSTEYPCALFLFLADSGCVTDMILWVDLDLGLDSELFKSAPLDLPPSSLVMAFLLPCVIDMILWVPLLPFPILLLSLMLLCFELEFPFISMLVLFPPSILTLISFGFRFELTNDWKRDGSYLKAFPLTVEFIRAHTKWIDPDVIIFFLLNPTVFYALFTMGTE